MDHRCNAGIVKWVIIISATLYAFIKALKFTVGIHSGIDGYATDLLCLPLVLGCSILLLRTVFRNRYLILSPAKIVLAFIAFSLIFELVLPAKSTVYVADIWDVVAYALGGLIFYFLQKKIPARAESLSEEHRDLSMKEGGKSLS
jgi:hypothetical protein